MFFQPLSEKWDPQLVGYALTGTVVAGGAVALLAKLYRAKKYGKEEQKWRKVGRDVVVLHQYPRGNTCINLSPFPIKVETFLRMNGIKYVTETAHAKGAKGKTPWITFNGENIADSQLIVEHLSRHFDLDMNSHLSREEKAIARSMRIMIEDHLYWWAVVEKVRS